MIPNITRGRRAYGLLVYLWGPGRREEHVDPHLVAAWDGAGELAGLEPVARAGRHDVRQLVDLLEIPVQAGRNPPRRPVWHCSVRAHPTDPILTDQQWRDIATDVLARVGLAPPGDEQAVRWIAMRHGPDHIHIVATLVRQDRRTYWARNDYPLAQAACRDIEHRYNVVRVAPPGRGSRSFPKARELNKNQRRGPRKVTPRDELRRRVRDASTHAIDEQDFITRLTADRTVTVRLRESERNPGEITGYAVHLAGDTTATGEPIFYSGATLAKELSLTRLRQRWRPDTTLAGSDRRAHQLRPTPAEVYQRAAEILTNATSDIRARAASPTASGIAAATADLLAALARAWEGPASGPLTRAADLFDRAAHEPHRTPPAGTGRAGYPLRVIARLLSTGAGRGRGQRDLDAMLQLVRAIASIADAIGDLRQAQQRLHQAHAAYMAAVAIKAYQPPPQSHVDTPRHQPPRSTLATSPRRPRHGR